jgi:hypothetical protein
MSKKSSALLTLCMSAVCLCGCSLIRVAGPCFGVGCPSGTEGKNAQYKPGEAAKPQTASVPPQTPATQSSVAQTANAPAQTASTSAQPVAAPAPATQSPATQPNVAQSASAQPAATPDPNADAKPSPFHAIGDFFAHLIPHHSSDAKSGAAD